MTDQVLCTEIHPQSRRRALVAHEPGSVWLYLTHADADTITGDCWLFNHGVAPSAELLRGEGSPPPAPHDALEPGGQPVDLPRDLAFLWSRDGEAVAACSGGVILGFIPSHSHGGLSRFLRHPGPWGRPFDALAAARLFAVSE